MAAEDEGLRDIKFVLLCVGVYFSSESGFFLRPPEGGSWRCPPNHTFLDPPPFWVPGTPPRTNSQPFPFLSPKKIRLRQGILWTRGVPIQSGPKIKKKPALSVLGFSPNCKQPNWDPTWVGRIPAGGVWQTSTQLMKSGNTWQ